MIDYLFNPGTIFSENRTAKTFWEEPELVILSPLSGAKSKIGDLEKNYWVRIMTRLAQWWGQFWGHEGNLLFLVISQKGKKGKIYSGT